MASDDKEVDEKRKLFIGGLSYDTTDESLRRAFEVYGPVVAGQVMKNRETNTSRGFGFITFENTADAQKAYDGLNGQLLDGRQVRVDFATRKGDAPAGGRYPPSRPGDRTCFQWANTGSCIHGNNCKFEHDSSSSRSRDRPYTERGGYADDKRYDERSYGARAEYGRADYGRSDYGRDYGSSRDYGRSDYGRGSDDRGDYSRAPADYGRSDYRAADYGRSDYSRGADYYRSGSDYRSDYRPSGTATAAAPAYRTEPARTDYGRSDYRSDYARTDTYRSAPPDYSRTADYRAADYRGASSADSYRAYGGSTAAAPASSSSAYRPADRDYARPADRADYRAPSAPAATSTYPPRDDRRDYYAPR